MTSVSSWVRTVRLVTLILSVAITVLFTAELSAQVGVVGDVIRGAAKASKANKIARAGRIAADVTDSGGRLLRRLPASAATRRAFGLDLTVAATDAFEAVPSTAGRIRIYLGDADDGLKFVPDSSNSPHVSTTSPPTTLNSYLDAMRSSGQNVEGVDYIVETDVLPGAAPRAGAADRLFLANYGARPWPVRSLGDGGAFAAEVTPTVWLRISEETIEDVKHLFDLSFNAEDVRVGSLFDETADVESVEALRAASGKTAYRNIASAEEALDFVGERRGKVVALVGHVEEQQFVVAGVTGEKFRVAIASLVEAAERRGVSLLLLGCDTSAIDAASGVAGRINSIAVASQLHKALTATTYGDFLSALGTPVNPVVLSRQLLGHAQMIVGTRLRREVRAQRAGVVSVQAFPKLARLQTENSQQMFRSLPYWLDSIVRVALGLTFWAFLIALVAAAFKRSWSPVRTTAVVAKGILLTPFYAARWIFASR